MAMIDGEFFSPCDLEETCELLDRYKGKAHVLAGGTNVMVMMNKKRLSPKVLIYIGESGLDYIKDSGDNLIIGGTTTFSDIMYAAQVKRDAPLLVDVVSHMGSPAIRNMGTIGGNLANGSPASDASTALLALDAGLVLISKTGERSIACDDFFLSPGQTALKPNELIREVVVPKSSNGAKWAYYKLGRRKAHSLSVVSVAIWCRMDKTRCTKARIALGAVAPTPMLASEAASILKGKPLEDSVIEKAAKAAAQEADPIDDVRGSAWYRRRVIEVLVKRLLRRMVP
jgi:carbon-monoxide dehydrogenase medium subunit